MIKRILVATSLLCMCCILFAQNVQVKGKVVSENEAVEFANVVLQTKDSIFIAGGVTDSKGRFMMENIQGTDIQSDTTDKRGTFILMLNSQKE